MSRCSRGPGVQPGSLSLQEKGIPAHPLEKPRSL